MEVKVRVGLVVRELRCKVKVSGFDSRLSSISSFIKRKLK